MMTRDPMIGEAIDRLAIPEHRPGFTDELMSRIDQAEQESPSEQEGRTAPSPTAVPPTFATDFSLVDDGRSEFGEFAFAEAPIVELQTFAEKRSARRPMSRKLLAGLASVAAVGLLPLGSRPFETSPTRRTPRSPSIRRNPRHRPWRQPRSRHPLLRWA